MSRICGALLLVAAVSAHTHQHCSIDKLTIYKVVVTTFWTRERFPKHYPDWRPPAQWSKTVGKSISFLYHTEFLRIFWLFKIAKMPPLFGNYFTVIDVNIIFGIFFRDNPIENRVAILQFSTGDLQFSGFLKLEILHWSHGISSFEVKIF
jgi:Spondin_N